MIRLTWDLPAEAEHVRLCRNLVRDTLSHLEIGKREIEDLELAIGELSANVIRHARLSAEGSFLVELEVRDEDAVITVTDLGVGFTPEISDDPTPTDSGGLGLWLVGQLTDRLEFQKADGRGTVVRAVRHLRSGVTGRDRAPSNDALGVEEPEEDPDEDPMALATCVAG